MEHVQQDVLSERGPRLVAGGHDDVAGSRLVGIPALGIQVVVLIDVVSNRQVQYFGLRRCFVVKTTKQCEKSLFYGAGQVLIEEFRWRLNLSGSSVI